MVTIPPCKVVGATHISPKLHLMKHPPCSLEMIATGPSNRSFSKTPKVPERNCKNALKVFDDRKSALTHHKSPVKSFTVVGGERDVRWRLLLGVMVTIPLC